MCGFVGAFGPSASELDLNLALTSIRHRGPDDSGTYIDNNCCLAHCRLSIIDTSDKAKQPMMGDNNVLVYNGEVYNHQDLRKQKLSDFNFRSTSDTETMFYGIKKMGPRFLNKCSGMFAGAFYSKSNNKMLLFRDPQGIKPLYYSILNDSTVIFGSELKALFRLYKKISRKVNIDVLKCYLSFENYPQDTSMFDSIVMLAPGQILDLHYNEGKILKSTTNIEQALNKENLDYTDEAQLIYNVRSKIEQSIKSHLLSDVPLGVYLSGGIDSSTVAAVASKNAKGIMGFTGYFDGHGDYYDERNVARISARSLGIELQEIPIRPKDFLDHFDNVVKALDEPRMGMGSFSQFIVAREASKYRKVILAGHGGDELFGGYPQFKAFYIKEMGWLSLDSIKTMFSLKSKEIPWVVNQIIQSLPFQKTTYAARIFRNMKSPYNKEFSVDKQKNITTEALALYYKDIYIPGLLIVEDKISMAHSLETRVPLWSPEVINLAEQIPMKDKIKHGQLKWLLKKSVSELIPKEVLSAPKRGFPTPLKDWFRKELFKMIQERLLGAQNLLFEDLISRNEIEGIIKSHKNNPLPFALDELRAHKIWMLLCLESWARQFEVTK